MLGAAPRSSEVDRSRSAIPMMPFIGVRISWLMFARNSLLARFAAFGLDRGPLSGPPPRAVAVRSQLAPITRSGGRRHLRRTVALAFM